MTCIGIDFGTTNSVVTRYNTDSGRDEIILNFPTVLFFEPFENQILFGKDAEYAMKSKCYQEYIHNGISNIKRLIGKPRMSDDLASFFSHNKISDDLVFTVFYNNKAQEYSIQDVLFIFFKMISSKLVQFDDLNAVITVPVYFNDTQRELLKSACTHAGINVLRILNEPTSATLAYIDNSKKSERVLTIDCGGGTTDLALIDMDYSLGVYQVLCTSGDPYLGGEDLTRNLEEYMCARIQTQTHPQVQITPKLKMVIHNECERVKKVLSSNLQTVSYIELGGDSPVSITTTRVMFLEQNKSFFSKIYSLIDQVLAENRGEIDKIVFIGGSTRIPHFKTIFSHVFKIVPEIVDTIDPDLTVAIGACRYSAMLQGVSSQETKTLLDLVALTIGVEAYPGVMVPVISRNSILPVSGSCKFTNTCSDDSLKIKVFQGERRFTRDNNCIAEFDITGLGNQEKGTLDITVTFHVNLDSIISAEIVVKLQETNLACCTIDKIKTTMETCSFNKLLIESEMFKIQDNEEYNKIHANTELYDMFKRLVQVSHEHDVCGDFTISALNTLFNDTYSIIMNFHDYSCKDLEMVRESFNEQWHHLMFPMELPFGSTEISGIGSQENDCQLPLDK